MDLFGHVGRARCDNDREAKWGNTVGNDGRDLESLVAFVEKTLGPRGFEVKTNTKVFDDDGNRIAEFDVEVRGKFGSTEIAWLIECRDRPSQGAAPNGWIEQLVGRRARFGLNKVTAVSTTGFAPGVREYAEREGIELREVKSLAPDQFGSWLAEEHMTVQMRECALRHAVLIFGEDEPKDLIAAALAVIAAAAPHAQLLRASDTGELVRAREAFTAAVSQNPALSDGLTTQDEPRLIKMMCSYTNDASHFVLGTPKGNIRVRAIFFEGTIEVVESKIPFEMKEYRQFGSRERIAQVAAVEVTLDGKEYAIELHRISDAQQMHFVMRPR